MPSNVITATGSESRRASDVRRFLARYEEQCRRALILIALFGIPLHLSINSVVVTDADLWWHLRTGQWIVEHGTVPTIDAFSIYGMGKPLVAYSWLFEVLVYGAYRMLGLTGIVFFNATLSALIAIALYSLVRKLERNFANAALLTGICLGTLPYMPRPWLFTILFFIIELDILFAVRETGRFYRRLWLLPPLFVLWANLHIQFIYGFFVLGLFAAEPVLDWALRKTTFFNQGKSISIFQLWPVAAVCAIATLLTPYHFKLYHVVFETVGQTRLYQFIGELQSLRFRHISDWLVLLITLSAAFAVGWRRSARPLLLLLLLTGVFLSFRSSRDAWFVTVVGVAIIATSRAKATVSSTSVMTKGQVAAVVVCVSALLVLLTQAGSVSEGELQKEIDKKFPVAAVKFIEEQGYAGPLYNHFDWGGYLIWQLRRLPVSMDGRGNVHSEDRIERSIATWTGRPDWAFDPELAKANLVIAQINQPLASVLRLDSRFQLVYEDKVATVFVKRIQP